ncbi:G5 domain-containing protein [Anaerococcus martiniensis]|uniref:G5 domain-containing protein n=1 Tax=Anaerococcus sp. WGS1579 TaxID=3366809 RepID=UPI00372D2C99
MSTNKAKKKNKFIIGLSSTMLGAVMLTAGPDALAAKESVVDTINENKSIADAAGEEYLQPVVTDVETEKTSKDESQASDAEKTEEDKANVATDASIDASINDSNNATETPTEAETGLTEEKTQSETPVGETSEEQSEPESLEQNEATQKEENTPAAEETASNNDVANTEATYSAETSKTDDQSPAQTNDESPTNTENTENSEAVDTSAEEKSTEEKLEADKANPDADADEDATATENNETQSQSPQETPAGDEPTRNPEAGYSPEETPTGDKPANDSSESSDTPQTKENAELSESTEGTEPPKKQTFAAGDSPLTEEGAEIAPGESVKDSEEKVEDAKAYNLNSQVPDGYKKVDDAISYRLVKANPKYKDKGYFEIAIRVDTTNRAIDDLYYNDSFDFTTGVLDQSSIKFKSKGDKLAGKEDAVNFEPTSDLNVSPSGRRLLNLNYTMTPEDLKTINERKGETIFAISGRYTTPPPENASQFGASTNVYGHLIPYPNENNDGDIISVNKSSVNGNDKLNDIPVTEESPNRGIEKGVYDTGITIDNLYAYDSDDNLLEDNSNRITGRVYTRAGKELDDVRVFYDGKSVKLKLPEGAIKDQNSVFNGDLKDYKDLEVELFIRPRTDEEISTLYKDYIIDSGLDAPEDAPDVESGSKTVTNEPANEAGTDTKTESVTVNTYDRVRYDNFNTLGRFEISLDDQSNYDVTHWKDGKDNTDKVTKVTAGKPTTIEEKYNAYNSELKSDLDAAIDDEIAEREVDTSTLIKVNDTTYKTRNDWKIELDEKNIIVTPPRNAEKGDETSLPVNFKFSNGSEKNFNLSFRVDKEVIDTPKYDVKVDEPNTEIFSRPFYDGDLDTVPPDRVVLNSKFNEDDHGNLWKVTIDEESGEITAKTPGEVNGEYTLKVPVTAYYEDPELKDENGNPLVYTRKTYAEFRTKATKPYERTYTEKEPISYPVTIQQDPTMENGKQEIVQQGKDGVKEVTYNQKYNNDGTKDGAPTVVDEKVLTEATTHIIKVGTKTENTKTITETIPFDYKVEYDENLEAEKYVIEPGTNGTKTTTWNIVNSEIVGEPKVETTDPVQGIIRVGSKDFTGDVTHKDKEEIPYKVITKENPDLAVGTTKVTTPGEVGTKEVTYTLPVRNGAIDSQDGKTITSTENITKKPVDEVVEIGTKPIEETVEIPFNTEYKYDDTLEAGEIKEETAGKNGENKVVTSYDPATKSAKMTEEVVTEPTNRVVKVGGMTNGTETVTEKVPFEVEVRKNPALKKGEYKVIQDGVVGEKEKILTIENSKVTDTAEGKTITESKNQIIEVGSADFTGEVTHEVTEEIPFTVKIVEDQTMAPGTSRVETKGEAGSKTTRYTQAIKNGAADGELKSEEIVKDTTKAPVEEVIHVGTAPVNSEDTATSGDVPVDIRYTYDPTKERGTAEKGAFTPGKVETIIKNEYNPETGKIETTTEETVTNAKQEIIVGTKDYTGTFEHKETELTPFKTEIIHDPTLKAGETVTDQVGVNGVKERTITQNFTNGDVAKKSYSDWNTVSEVKNEIIRVGSLTEGTKKHEEAIPFDYKVEYDPAIPAGEYKITQEGKDGKRTTEWTIENSKVVGDPKVTEEAPVDAIIKVGNKDFTGVVTHTEDFTIPYKVEIKENPDLPVGKRNTIQEGTDGSYKITYKQNIKNGETTGELTKTESERVEAQNQIIEIGTKPVDPVEKDVSTQVGVEVEIKDDPNLDLGKSRTGELIPGKVENVVTTKYDPATGELITREDKKVTPAKQIIYVGTKDLEGTQEFVVTQPVPFETEYIEDSALEAGKTEIKQQGQNGSKDVTYKAEAKNGEVTSHKATEEITKEPVKQIIRVGTKSEKTNTEVVKENIPFKIEYEYTDELEAGKIEVKQEGELGEKTTTTTTTIVNGTESTDKNEETTKEPVKRIVRVGTKIDRQTTDVIGSETTIIPYKTTVIYDPNLKAGEQVVDTKGEDGERKITVTVPVKDGVAGDPVIKTEDIKKAVDEVIRVGTRDDSSNYVSNTNVITENIPFETRYEEDPNLPVGETRIETPGEFGSKTTTTSTTIVDGESKTSTDEKVTKEPVVQVVKVGTKLKEIPAQSLETTKTEEIPYTTIIRENEKMQVGSSKVLENGENGETTIKTTVDVENGVAKAPVISTEITKEAKPRIIEVGTKPIEEKVTEKVPFETEVIFDNTMPLNEKSVSGGVAGEKVTTITHRYENGQIVTTKDEKTTVSPTKQIVRVGTKTAPGETKDVEKTIEVEVPYTTEIIYDNTLPAGTESVVEDGEVGTRTITFKVPIKEGIAGDAEIIQNEVTTEPKAKKIKVGTMRTDTVTTITETVKPFETEIVYDDTMEKGTSKVTQEGKNGIETKTIVATVINGVTQENPAVKVSETGPTKQIITVGTKCPDQKTAIDTVVEEITPFEVKIIYDDTLEKGKEVVDTEGQNGIDKVTYTTTVENGKAVGEAKKTNTQHIQEKIDKVIRIGTKCPESPKTPETQKGESKDVVSTTIVEIPFDTEIIQDDTIEAGKVIEEQAGQKGEQTITTAVNIKDGVSSEPNVTSVVTKEPIKRIVRVGTKKTPGNDKPETTIRTEKIPFETTVIYDNTLPEGKQVVLQEGEEGIRTITTTGDKVSEQITKAPKPRIVRIGTKKIEDNNTPSPRPIPNPIPSPNPDSSDDNIIDEPTRPVEPSNPIVEQPNQPSSDPELDDDDDIVDNDNTIDNVDDESTENVNEPSNTDDEITDLKPSDEPIDSEKEDIESSDTDIANTKENRESSDDDIANVKEKRYSEDQAIDGVKVPNSVEKIDNEKITKSTTNPKTGIGGSAKVTATLAASLIGLFASKKKKEDEEE